MRRLLTTALARALACVSILVAGGAAHKLNAQTPATWAALRARGFVASQEVVFQ